MTIEFTSPELTELTPKITVFGVGGAGGNAVNNMVNSSLKGVDFVCANTDAQALSHSLAEQKIQLGAELTQGLGAGARPEVGRAAAEETMELIEEHLEGCHMVFITAGMGGGTGTGAAPIIAQRARDKGILTVGVVTKPFQFEGGRRMKLAEDGIGELSKHVDTLIIIPNQNLFRIANEKTTFADAFAMADEVLHSGVRGVTDLMMLPGLVNLDFADVRTVMSEMGKAMMGTGEAEGENRALDAAEAAISNPLLDEVSMQGAQGVLINITGGMDLTLFEVDEAANRIRGEVDPEANILVGSALDSSLDGKMRVSVVATGIEADSMPKAELPQKIYSKTKVDTPVIEETVHETSEPLAEVVEEPLDLTNEVEDELEELVDRLQKEKTSEEQALKGFVTEHTADDRDAPFIAPEAAIPEVTVEELAAEPEMVREPIIETVVEEAPRETPRQKLGLFQNLLGSKKEPAVQKEPILKNTASMQQGDMLDFGSTSELELADEKEQSKPELIISKEPVVEKTAEEDHLEIPAFLRRQAN
ncbi:MAG: cell division protein FtsZ [Emcibacteraceae bacterium]|nr:cell division protein FtsZ [Emcibacteraceae bacterium]